MYMLIPTANVVLDFLLKNEIKIKNDFKIKNPFASHQVSLINLQNGQGLYIYSVDGSLNKSGLLLEKSWKKIDKI